ncbi:uncharacterized protein [Dysidea avara]|uniref:uncharacterized protein n=1 Tax=Dysidea avara TaxID=196820 RepID=UPI003329A07C
MLLLKLSTWIGNKSDDPGHPDYVPAVFSDVKPHVIAKLKKDVERYLRLRNKIRRTTGLRYYRDDGVTEVNSLNGQVDLSNRKSTYQSECSLSSNHVEEDHLRNHEQGYHQPDELVIVEEVPKGRLVADLIEGDVAAPQEADDTPLEANDRMDIELSAQVLQTHQEDCCQMMEVGMQMLHEAEESECQLQVNTGLMNVGIGVSLPVQDDCCQTNAESMEVCEVSPEVQDAELMDIGVQVSPSVQDSCFQTDTRDVELLEAGVQVCIAVEGKIDVEMMETGVQVSPDVQDSCNQTDYAVQLTEKGVQVDLFLTAESLEHNDRKVKYYTGLPNFATLKLVFDVVTSGLNMSRGVLTTFQEIFMVLMKLRLDLEEVDLAYRFGISQPTVSRIFRKWIDIMAKRLHPFIQWPERAELRETMPMAFRRFFSRCVCIIDCTEIFIDRPSNLKARAQTWSNYKQHNTAKVLIAITPQGSISFVSKAWGGRVSDKYITENCGILDKLLPGDLILADRGFTIQDSIGLYCAEVKTPSFTRGKKQLSRHDIDWSREISHVRIHVERVIGMLKQKYKILKGILPITLLKDGNDCTIDNILITCSALCNLCASIIPFD